MPLARAPKMTDLPPNLAKPHAGQQGVVEEFRKVLPMGIGCEDDPGDDDLAREGPQGG